MTTPLLPMPATVKRTLLRALDTEREEYGRHSDLDDARNWIKQFEAAWPSLADLPDGADIYQGMHPVAGEPGA